MYGRPGHRWSVQTCTKAFSVILLMMRMHRIYWHVDNLQKPLSDNLKPIIIADAVVSSFCIIANILLLVAAIKNSYPKLLLSWLATSILTFIITVVLHTLFAIRINAYRSQDSKDISLLILIGITYVTWSLLVWSTVFIYYTKMRLEALARNNLPLTDSESQFLQLLHKEEKLVKDE